MVHILLLDVYRRLKRRWEIWKYENVKIDLWSNSFDNTASG